MTQTESRPHHPTDKPRVRKNFRPDLEGMRAVAVLAVVLDHLFGWPSGGFVGVDIFFVLSGFFITGLLVRERTESRTVSFRNFYVRRVRRIIPAAMLVLVVTTVLGYVVFPAVRAKETLMDALWSSVFLANWRFESVGTDYFQDGLPPSPLQHFWSLSIEEQFYFVWPVLLVGIFYVTHRSGRRQKTAMRHSALAAVMFGIVVASFAWAMTQSPSEPTSAYFSTFTRVWELGIGALVAIAGPALAKLPQGNLRLFLAYTGLAGIVASLFLITSETQFPGPGAALPVLSTALVIASFHGSQVYGMQVLTNPVAQYFGKTSYSLYLWHWPVIVLLAAVMSEELPYYVIAAILALVLAHVSFTYYEDPIRKSKWLERDTEFRRKGDLRLRISPQSWSMMGFFVAAILVVSIFSIQITDRNARTGETHETLAIADISNPNGTPTIDPCLGAAAIADPNAGCTENVDLKSLKPSLDSFAKDTQGAFACWRAKGQSMPTCNNGSKQADALRIALIGDSHAATLLPALGGVLLANNWNLTSFVGEGCQWQVASLKGDCGAEMAQVQDTLLNGEPFDVILTTASRKYGDSNSYAATWAPVAARGTKVVAIGDNPAVSSDMIGCLTRFGASESDITGCGQSHDAAFAMKDPLVAAIARIPDGRLIDLTDLYCRSDWCPSVIGNAIVYRDTGGHLTGTYSKTLGPQLAERVTAALGQ